jgi:4-aminobutyrate aminotransferase
MRDARERINNSKTLQIIKKFKRLTYCSTYTYPLVIKGGHECFINDIDGNEFLDFTSNIGSCPLGYSHPANFGKKYENFFCQ